jgi:hypothetical protein
MLRKFLHVCGFNGDTSEINHILRSIELRFSIQEFAMPVSRCIVTRWHLEIGGG